MLALLRARKYSMDSVYDSVEKFAVVFAQQPTWFDITPERFQRSLEILDYGVGYMLKERDQNGCRVFVVNAEVAGENNCRVTELIRLGVVIGGYVLREDETQICGIKIILDCSRLTMDNIVPVSLSTVMSLGEMVKLAPVRIKEIHVIGISSFFVTIYEMSKNVLTEKIRGRIFFHKESEFEKPSCAKEDVIDPKEIAARKDLLEVLDRMLRVKVKPEFLKKQAKDTESIGSFRKLEID
jgi:hypothetical protein